MKRALIVLVVLVMLVGIFWGGYAYGLNIYTKSLDAVGFLELTDEVIIDEIEIDDATTLKVQCAPTGNTQADVTYTVHAYLDGVDTAQQTVSWTAGEISASDKKTVTFSGLNLTAATNVKAEVTH